MSVKTTFGENTPLKRAGKDILVFITAAILGTTIRCSLASALFAQQHP